MKKIIGGAWPYANGSLHIGHIAGLLPGDVLARYFRLKGDQVIYVSGTDAHGTPVSIRAINEGRSPEVISQYYHKEFVEVFNYLGFSYDHYGITSSTEHKSFVQAFHKKLYESPYIVEKEVPQTYCKTCDQILVDRLVLGKCPNCQLPSRGDQCDHCGAVYQPEELLEPTCSICGDTPEITYGKHLHIALSQLSEPIEKLLEESSWKHNANTFTTRYIQDGLRDRAITRDLDWGIDVPKEGYDNKSIYIWAENVLGYLSGTYDYLGGSEEAFEGYWNHSEHYYVHGKDNIPFHTIILPGLLLAHNGGYHLPDKIISSEHLTYEGKKISTSAGWGIWVKDIVDDYQADAFRYFLLSNGPEKRDSDFSWYEFKKTINGELLGSYGNLINRTLAFIEKRFDGVVPQGLDDESLKASTEKCFKKVGKKIEAGELKGGISQIFSLVREGNKYFDEQKPWATAKSDLEACNNTLYNCVQLIGNLSVLLEPFIPHSSAEIFKWLGVNKIWQYQELPKNIQIKNISILFDRLE